jgi:hypothetical protein
MAKENKRVVIADVFEPAQLLALAKACPKSEEEKARAALKTGVYQVDVTVRVKGDLEVGVPEKAPGKFETAKYLVAALAALPADRRKKILARPAVKKDVRAIVEAEIKAVRERQPKKPAPAKLTPHLVVTRVAANFLPAALSQSPLP